MKTTYKSTSFLDKNIILTMYNLFKSSNEFSSDTENTHIERVTVLRYKTIFSVGFNKNENILVQSNPIDEMISIKY
jgi:hypothetical protein